MNFKDVFLLDPVNHLVQHVIINEVADILVQNGSRVRPLATCASAQPRVAWGPHVGSPGLGAAFRGPAQSPLPLSG